MSIEDIYDRLDLMDYDDLPTCEHCGKPLTSDLDGDGVMTAQVYFCEHCDGESGAEAPKQVNELGGET